MTFSAASLGALLEAHTPTHATGWVVAISGGTDSACLLTALTQLTSRGTARLPVRAVHVDHGLQPAAADFRRACTQLCQHLGVALETMTVVVEAAGGVSLEAAARDARYGGIAQRLAFGECLLTAHHASDQAETVLLQLLRGAGLKGLSAMPMCRPLGRGWHLRPLLDVAKRDLVEFGQAQRVVAVADPMNADLRFDRVYLRTLCWPSLEARWPGVSAALSRTARHAADAQELLDVSGSEALDALRDGDALSIPGLRVLPAPQQRNVLRLWIAAAGRVPPSTARLGEALRQVIDADDEQLPCVVWGDHALRRYRGRLFQTPAEPPHIGSPRAWPIAADGGCYLGEALGTLRRIARVGGLDATRMPEILEVRQRAGGETLRPHPRARTQSLQHLCQSLGVLPWMRDALPLLFAGGDLIAVGDLWLDSRWCVAAGEPGSAFVWEGAPSLV